MDPEAQNKPETPSPPAPRREARGLILIALEIPVLDRIRCLPLLHGSTP